MSLYLYKALQLLLLLSLLYHQTIASLLLDFHAYNILIVENILKAVLKMGSFLWKQSREACF